MELGKNNKITLRILQVIGAMDRGGAETMIMNLYRNIDREKIQFDFLLSSSRRGQYEDEIEALGGRIYHIKHFTGLNPLSYYHSCKKFFSEHKEYRVVHGHIGSSASLYLKAAKEAGCYTIAHSHNGKPKLSLHSIVYSLYSYPTRYIADQLFGCSTEAGIARFGERAVNSSKYRNFNNGISLNQFYFSDTTRKEVRKELGIANDIVVVGTVGRIAEQKNPLKILDIFNTLIETYQDVECIWVGTGPMEDEIKEKLSQHSNSGKIHLLGVRSDVPRILQAFDAFVFPSLWEGLPVTIIEAQAAGLPIILSDKISKEVEITPLLTWTDINDSSDKWASVCYQKSAEYLNRREEYESLVKKSGYDIIETADELSKIYLSHS